MVSNLSSRIRHKLNMTMAQFCEKHLETDYRTFQYRMRRESFIPAEVIYICWILNDTCDNIFGKSFADLVLLKRAPGLTSNYIREKLTTASAEDLERMMNLIGGISMKPVKEPQKIVPAAESVFEVEDFVAEPVVPAVDPAPKSSGMDFIDIDLSRGMAGK